MLVVSDIRENFDSFQKGLDKRGFPNSDDALREIIAKDDKRKELQGQLDEVLSQSNLKAREIGQLMKSGEKEAAEEAKKETGELKSKGKVLSEQLQNTELELRDLLFNVPNIPNDIVPAGASEEDNEIVRQVGDLPSLDSGAKPHWDLIKDFDLIDFDLGNKVTGAGFPFYKREAAQLVRALINYFLVEANKKGYMEIMPPVLVNEESGYGTGQLPDKEGQMYHIEDTSLYLIPTAEVPITNIYRNEILDESDLPIKVAGYTQCFRREAGSWGSHVRGLNRLHQFDKVEIVQINHPDKSYDALDEMISHVESLVQSLELPYRILRLCGGDLGFTSSITYDFEVYSAAQKKWLEVSSVSNFEKFQANRLKLRYRNTNGKKILAHTLNGSALAIPRILAAILENNQSANEIKIPKVLHPFLSFESIIRNP